MDPHAGFRRAFGAVARPSEFVDPNHCRECAEHNETLLAHTPDTISLAELGNPGWDPICFVQSIDAFRYYLPAMTRLSTGTGSDYYLGQLSFQFTSARIQQLAPCERAALADFLDYLIDAIPRDIDGNLDTDDLLDRIEELRGSGEGSRSTNPTRSFR